MSLTVRKAQIEDIPSIYEITKEAFNKYAENLGLPDRVSALNETYDTIKNEMNNKHIFIAVNDGVPVGSIRYEIVNDNIAYISRFGVRVNSHNCGIGKSLIKAVEDHSQEQGASCLVLHTCSKITSLVNFYYKMGFYIYSTAHDRGYVRALFIKELADSSLPDLNVVNIK